MRIGDGKGHLMKDLTPEMLLSLKLNARDYASPNSVNAFRDAKVAIKGSENIIQLHFVLDLHFAS
jgi:hypothetical protein